MKLNGEVKFDHPVGVVWEALHDTEVLKDTIPGCEGFSLQKNGEYKVHLNVTLGAIKGNYTCKVKWKDIETPHDFSIIAKRGASEARVNCKLIPLNEGTCQLVWDCQAEISGKLAKVGSKVLGGVAKYMANKFFKQINKQLQLLSA